MRNWTELTDRHLERHRGERHRGERHRGRPAWARLLFLGALAACLLAFSGSYPAAQETAAQETAVESAGTTAPAAPAGDELRTAVEEHYRARASAEGILLEPRDEVPGVQSIEVRSGEVAINGEVVSPTILRSWFRDEAEVLLALAALDGDAARELLGVPSAEEVAAAARAGDEEGDAAGAEAAEAEDGEVAEVEAPAPPAPPQPPARSPIRTGAVFKVGSNVVVEPDEEASEVLVIGGTVRVEGRVLRDVVAIGGRVEVLGEVGNEVVAIGGGVELGPESRVDNNVLAVGGSVARARGAEVGGEVTRVGLGGIGGGVQWDDWSPDDRRSPFRAHRLTKAYWNLVGIAVLALLVCFSLLVARGPVQGAARRLDGFGEVLLAALVGLLGIVLVLVLLPVVIILLVASLVGCLLVPLVFFLLPVLLVVALFGYAGAALRLGRWLGGRFGWKMDSPYVAALVGVAGIEVWTLIGKTLGVLDGPVWFFAMLFVIFGCVIELVAWLAGFGGILMHFIEGRRGGGAGATAGAPLPPASPVPTAPAQQPPAAPESPAAPEPPSGEPEEASD